MSQSVFRPLQSDVRFLLYPLPASPLHDLAAWLPRREQCGLSVDLAQLDLVYRIGLLDLQPINDAMVEDIRNMLALVPPDDFRAKQTCVLNPTFGAASELVGGADGDLFIHGMLVDITVNKHLG